MVNKRKKPVTKKRDPNALKVEKNTDESNAEAFARKLMMPSVTGSLTMQSFGKSYGELDLMALIKATQVQIQAVHDGDMQRTEELLITQAHTLDAMFNVLAQHGIKSDTTTNLESYLKLSLKAQAQCRSTLEALAEIKNPRTTSFVGQQNVGLNQQINNSNTPDPQASTCAQTSARGKNKKQPNELLTKEVDHGTTLDSSRKGKTGGTNQNVEAVGTINRR